MATLKQLSTRAVVSKINLAKVSVRTIPGQRGSRQAGGVGGARKALLRQQDTSLRGQAVRNHDHLPTACELVVDTRFFQTLGGVTNALDREPAGDGYEARSHPPLREAPDGCGGAEPYQDRGGPLPSSEPGKGPGDGVCHWDLLLHLHHRAIRLGELVADLDEDFEGDASLFSCGHHLVDFDGVPTQKGADGVARLVLKLGNFAERIAQSVRERRAFALAQSDADGAGVLPERRYRR